MLLSAVVGVSLATGGFAIGVGATGLAAGSPWFWSLSRAAGFVAYLFAPYAGVMHASKGADR